jgi:nucleoside-diphosphate-sugar epimerase
MPGPVALTGATGFIGKILLDRLTGAGLQVRALTRQPRPPQTNTQWVRGDLENTASLQELVRGAAAVIHCAGAVRGASLAAFLQTNTQGTLHLVEAALQQASPPRFLFISSLAAREPQLSWYATSKYRAEQTLAERAGTMPWTVFRPTAVYGPGDRELSPLFRATRRGVLPMVGRNTTHFGLLHVEDLATAVLAWLAADPPPEGVFELDDGTPGGYDRDQIAHIAGEVWDRPVRLLTLPATLIALVAGVNLVLSRLCRYAPMLTPGKVRELTHPDWVCDNTPLRQALPDWQPRIRLRDALGNAVFYDKTCA